LSTPDVKGAQEVTLLCIDDDKFWLQYEKTFLESLGYAVVTASSGREGLELADVHWFDVAIVDYCMPDMNGKEFAVAMRRRWPRIPIVMLSGMLDVPEAVFQVVDAFVAKECFVKGLPEAITLFKEEHSVHSGHPPPEQSRQQRRQVS
jgi:CheY-like chemotaxis protein